MTAQAITAARFAEARLRVARRKRVQPKLAAELISEVERLRGDLAAASTRMVELERIFATFTPPAVENTHIRYAALGNHAKANEVGAWIVESACKLLRAQIESQPEEKRNRTTIAMTWDDGAIWNLTLARGFYESAMEAQRDQARAQRDDNAQRLTEVLGALTALRALTQRVVDAQYPGDTEQPSVAVAVSQLSGWLNDNPEAK